MRTIFTFLNHLRGSMGNLQSSDVSHDRRLTVGSPSGLNAKWMLKLVAILAILLTVGVGNAWGAYSATFTRINSLSELSDGDSILVVIQDGKTLTSGYAIRNNSTNNAAVTISTTGTPSIACTQADIVWKYIVNSGTPTTYTFQRGTQRIAWTSSTTLSAVATANTHTWTITALSGYTGYFRIKSTGTGTRDIAVDGSHVFKAYANTHYINQMSLETKVALAQYHGAISIYKKGSSCSSPATPLGISASPVSITTDGTSTLSTSGGNGGAVTYTVTSANASSASIVGTTFSATAAGTYTVQASQDENGGTCGGTASTNITVTLPTRTVTWKVNGSNWLSGVVAGNTSVTSGGKISAVPTAPTSSNCDGSKVFVGWTETQNYSNASTAPTDLFTDVAGSPTINVDKTFYAVFATESNGSATHEIAGSSITGFDGGNGAYESGTYNTGDGFTIYCSNGYSTTQFRIAKSASITITSTIGDITQIVFTASGTDYKLNNNNISWTGTTGTYTNSGASTITLSNSNANIARITNIAITYGGTTYSNYETNCCTALGSINGSISLSHFCTFLHLVIISVFQRSIHVLLSVRENTISRYTLVYTYSMYCGSNGGGGLSLSLTTPTAEHAVYTTHGGRATMLLYASVFLPGGLHACLQPSAVPSLRGYVG